MPYMDTWLQDAMRTRPAAQRFGAGVGAGMDPTIYPGPTTPPAPGGYGLPEFGGPTQQMPPGPRTGELPRYRPGEAEARDKAAAIASFRLQDPAFAAFSDDEIWSLITQMRQDVLRGSYLSEEERARAERIGAGLLPRATAGAQDTPLDWAEFALSQQIASQTQAYQQAQLAQGRLPYEQMTAYQQASLTQSEEHARLQREQQQREMAASLGQAVAAMQAEVWRQGMPYALPKGTTYAPGFERGGPVQGMYASAGLQYRPQPLGVANPPSAELMQQWISDALKRFGP